MRDQAEPIAIIGLSGKFPGKACNAERLWEMCEKGEDAWTENPPSRFNHEAFYHPDRSKSGTVSSYLTRAFNADRRSFHTLRPMSKGATS